MQNKVLSSQQINNKNTTQLIPSTTVMPSSMPLGVNATAKNEQDKVVMNDTWKLYKTDGWSIFYPSDMKILLFNSGTLIAKLIGSDIEIDFSIQDNPTNISVENNLQEIKNKNTNCEIECTDMSAPSETITFDGKKALLQHNVSVLSNYALYIPLEKKFLVAYAYTSKNGFAYNGGNSEDWGIPTLLAQVV